MTSIGLSSDRRRLWTMRVTAPIVVAGSLAGAGFSVAHAVPTTTPKLAVVKVVTRHPVGKMLATVKGRSLYTIASNKCNKACLKFWPPLLMPAKSKAIPTGTTCLATLKFGTNRRQVTYRGLRLFTFVSDKGTSVKGNHVAGFLAAKVHTGGCPQQVVKIVTRKPFGKMLATTAGLSLYFMPTGTCDSTCQSFWPPLTLPKGSTAVPTGATCLGTTKLGQLRQITYRGRPLYTFYLDSGTSVDGNGQSGFVVAKVKTTACPK